MVIPSISQELRIRAHIHTSRFTNWIYSLSNAWRDEIYAEMDAMFLSVGEHRGVGLTRGIVDLEDGSIRDFVDIVVRHPLLYQAILEFSGII
jgi:hypothetical protein